MAPVSSLGIAAIIVAFRNVTLWSNQLQEGNTVRRFTNHTWGTVSQFR